MDSLEARTHQTPLTRREFTLDAALAILAGCVIMVSETACGSSAAAPTPVGPLADVNGTVSANHGHVAVVTGASITAGGALSFSIQGTSSHLHTLSMSQADLTSLKNKQTVVSQSSTDSGHSHTVTFTPV